MLDSQSYPPSLYAYDLYMRQVRHTPPLTDKEEEYLLQSICFGKDTQQARDRLVAGYQMMVIGLAKRFVRLCKEMELLDLVQEGNLGLLQAIERFDSGKGEASFGTFAFSWVRGCMLTAFWRNEGLIRLPLHKVRALRLMSVANTELLDLLGREPTIAETAHKMQISEYDVRELVVLQEQQVVSLHTFPRDDSENLPLEEVLADSTSDFTQDNSSLVDDALASLPENERLVVQLRYGFHDGQPYSQREVAALLGVACSTIAALDRRAHRRLRRVLSA